MDAKERYARQLMLPEWGEKGQEALGRARVLLAGVGGLGSPIATYLTAAGVGTLGLADADKVSVSNLQRQVLYDETQVGLSKVVCAAAQTEQRGQYSLPRLFRRFREYIFPAQRLRLRYRRLRQLRYALSAQRLLPRTGKDIYLRKYMRSGRAGFGFRPPRRKRSHTFLPRAL